MSNKGSKEYHEVPFEWSESSPSNHPLLSSQATHSYSNIPRQQDDNKYRFDYRRAPRKFYFISQRFIVLLVFGVIFISACALLIAALTALAASSTAEKHKNPFQPHSIHRGHSHAKPAEKGKGSTQLPPIGPKGYMARSALRQRSGIQLQRRKAMRKLIDRRLNQNKAKRKHAQHPAKAITKKPSNWWIQNKGHLVELARKHSTSSHIHINSFNWPSLEKHALPVKSPQQLSLAPNTEEPKLPTSKIHHERHLPLLATINTAPQHASTKHVDMAHKSAATKPALSPRKRMAAIKGRHKASKIGP